MYQFLYRVTRLLPGSWQRHLQPHARRKLMMSDAERTVREWQGARTPERDRARTPSRATRSDPPESPALS